MSGLNVFHRFHLSYSGGIAGGAGGMGVGGSIGAGGATIGGGGMLRMYDILYTLSQFINNCLPCRICFCFSVGIGVQPVIRRQFFPMISTTVHFVLSILSH